MKNDPDFPIAPRGLSHPLGTTPTERYLTRLSRRTFLNLWSYPCLFRDQGMGMRGEGAELCDLLVVFDPHVIIISDKDCEFPETRDLELGWTRWCKRAVLKSAAQVYAAERWLRERPDRVFLDRKCTQRFPLKLPDPGRAIYHRIVVAHDRTGRRRRATGGPGSLVLDSGVRGQDHLLRKGEGGHPFCVGQIDPSRGFVHVLDEGTLDVVLRTLDTVTDLVNYLTRKEDLLTTRRVLANGEEDLLALYLDHVDESDEHVFVVPPEGPIIIEPGRWAEAIESPAFLRKRMADRPSYLWDTIINFVGGHAMARTLRSGSSTELTDHERSLHYLARENRVRRRLLVSGFREALMEAAQIRGVKIRLNLPSHAGDPHYVFLAVDHRMKPRGGRHMTQEEYRRYRMVTLADYTVGVLGHHPEADVVIGIATEAGDPGAPLDRSFDIALADRADITEEALTATLQRCDERGWFKKVTESRDTVHEFPGSIEPEGFPAWVVPRVRRNEPCPCGSGKKYKKCHGV